MKAIFAGLCFGLAAAAFAGSSTAALAQTPPAPDSSAKPAVAMPNQPAAAAPAPAPQAQPGPQDRGGLQDQDAGGPDWNGGDQTYGGPTGEGPMDQQGGWWHHPHPGPHHPPLRSAGLRLRGPDIDIGLRCPETETIKACIDAVTPLVDKVLSATHH